MSTASQRRGFAGVTKLRKTLRRLDEESAKELKKVVSDSGKTLENLVRAKAPVQEGELREAVSHKVSSDGFTVMAGVSARHARGFKTVKARRVGKVTKGTRRLSKATIRNKNARWQLYKALWHEFGTKGGTYRHRDGSTRKIHAQRASHFHQRAYDEAAPRIKADARRAIKIALRDASQGGAV